MPVTPCKIRGYVSDLQKRGTLTFTLDEVRGRFPSFSEVAIKSALRRISAGGAVMPVRRGYYTIVPAAYALRGVLPPELYIDDLMKRLGRRYYVGLLNAAAFYGAAHQKPQAFSVIAAPPALRDTVKKSIHLNFITSPREIPQAWLKPFRTESGDIQVSRPELTAADLLTYQKEVGGLNRAATILYELAETLNFKLLDRPFFDFVPVSTVQRLGYLLECVLEQPKLADTLYAKAHAHKCTFQKIPLRYGKGKDNFAVDTRWKVVVNEQIEIDDI